MDEKEFLLDCLRKMLLIRRFEERAAQLYQMGKFGGFCHLYNGQEAVVVGSEAALREDDYIMTAYRDHAHALVRDVSARAAMAELLGKSTGCAGGKGGSMHFFNVEKGFMGGWGIVGGHIPLAAGIAFACRYQGNGRVCMVSLGDGAVPQGVVYETFNLAELWDCPLLIVIENNQYAMGTPLERSNANHEELYRRAEPFGIKCSRTDGDDVQVVYDFFKERIAEVREQQKPQLVEVMTYRYRGHSMSDPIHGHYRTKDEVEEQKKDDPIAIVRRRLVEDFKVSEDEIKSMDATAKEEVADAVKFAEESPVPEPEALYKDVYVEEGV